MSEQDLAGKTALITGGARGIGRAIAIKLAQHGANIALNYLSRDEDALLSQDLVAKEGTNCLLVKGDVSDPHCVEEIVTKTRERFGAIGILVVNAAISIIESHEDLSWETWKKIMSTNLDGAFLSIMAVKDEMLRNQYGRILCLSSVAALRPRQRQIHYSASKAAILALVRSCAEAFAPHVRVNGIAPGVIETEMAATLGYQSIQSIIAATPLGRLGQPDEVARVAYFLISDQSSFMTGQTVAVCGGRVMLP